MKCKDCKFLTGEKSSVGIECMNPEKQAIWNAKQERYRKAGNNWKIVVARYKQPSGVACTKFVKKGENEDCQWQ